MKTLGFRNSFKNKKRGRGSQTPGKQKAPCQVSSFDKFCARNSRSYKHAGYEDWLERTRKKNE
jgi:hypothetical protein